MKLTSLKGLVIRKFASMKVEAHDGSELVKEIIKKHKPGESIKMPGV